jgi:hypothetical protein
MNSVWWTALVAVGAGRDCREPSCAPLWCRPTTRSAKDTSVTAHCHAAPARLTREYQSDHRRHVLTPATTCAVPPNVSVQHSLDNTFHIRSAQRGTSAAATGGGGRSAPDPYLVLAVGTQFAFPGCRGQNTSASKGAHPVQIESRCERWGDTRAGPAQGQIACPFGGARVLCPLSRSATQNEEL